MRRWSLHASCGRLTVDCMSGWLYVGALGTLMAGIGCGGRTSDTEQPSDGAGGDSGAVISDAGDVIPSWDASQDVEWSPVCPVAMPTVGDSCSIGATVCEYGSAWWNVSCDQVFQCYSGTWTDYEASGQTCLPAPAPNSQSCPVGSGVIVQHSACPTDGLECFYGQGAHCICSGDDAAPGAGWSCLPETGCPSTRPRLGAACDSVFTCTYTECAYAEVCTNGIWRPDRPGC
jgi:hypothetical protein